MSAQPASRTFAHTGTRCSPRRAPTRLVRALRAGGRVGAITSDPLQGRGTYVVDSDGRITDAHISVSAADIPPAADLRPRIDTNDYSLEHARALSDGRAPAETPVEVRPLARYDALIA